MKRIFLSFLAGVSFLTLSAQNKFVFKDKISLECPEVQDQEYSGTCWCFSSMSFLESEMIKNGIKNPPNLSEMFVVRYNYLDRAKRYVMLHGNMTFSQGSYFLDNLQVMRDYGLMPESAYPNLKADETVIDHSLLESELKQFADSVAAESNEVINPDWVSAYNSLLDKHFNPLPETFEYEGKTYTPKTFATEFCKLRYDDYIQVTSFSHHGYYKFFPLELPDNWRWSMFLNVKTDDLITIIDNSLSGGHTVVWASDVSEDGFDYRRGYALLPGVYTEKMTKKEIEDFKKLPVEEQAAKSERLTRPGLEISVTEESRQKDFINRKTTDDHGMQIVGTAVDQKGNKFYKVKNSWGKTGSYDGYFYVSENFVKAKTTGLLVCKESCREFLKKAETEF
jgi:bleomycin hydrolase